MLTTALGCTSPTLYAAFGSKEGLYRKALAAYRRNDDITPGRAPDDLQPYEMVERYLRAAAAEFVNKDHPCGCMVAVGSLHSAPGNESASAAAAAARTESLNAFIARIELADRRGQFANPVNAEAIARFYTAVVQGMAVQAIDGASQDQLNLVVDMALSAWPTPMPVTSGGQDLAASIASDTGRPTAVRQSHRKARTRSRAVTLQKTTL